MYQSWHTATSASCECCLSVCLSVCLSLCLSACLCVWLPLCMSLWLSVSHSVSQSVCLCVCLCLFVCLSVCLSIYGFFCTWLDNKRTLQKVIEVIFHIFAGNSALTQIQLKLASEVDDLVVTPSLVMIGPASTKLQRVKFCNAPTLYDCATCDTWILVAYLVMYWTLLNVLVVYVCP